MDTNRKIRISNDRLWEHAESGKDIDLWLQREVGAGNWVEYFGFTALPYRSFGFKKESDATLFAMMWL